MLTITRLLPLCRRVFMITVMVTLVFTTTAFAQTLKERLEQEAAGNGTSASRPPQTLDEPKQTGKRYTVLCTQTHSFDYLTGLPKEDRLYKYTYCSLDWMNDMCRQFGSFDGGVFVLAGVNLTRDIVLGVFDLLAKKTQPDDEIFIYWHGHGGNDLPSSDSTEADGYDEYLVLFETDSSSANATRKTSITDTDFGNIIASLKDRRIMLVIETCHAGGMLESESTTGGGDTRGMKSFRTKPFTRETWEELQRNPFANSARRDYAAITGIKTMSAQSSVASPPSTLNDAMQVSRSQSANKEVLMTRFLTKSVERAKDISRTQPKLVAVFTCKEEESSYAGAYINKDKGIFLDSAAYAFALTVALGEEEFVKDKNRVHFSEFGDCVKVVIKNLKEELEVVQTPVFVDTLGPAYLRPPTSER